MSKTDDSLGKIRHHWFFFFDFSSFISDFHFLVQPQLYHIKNNTYHYLYL